MTIKKGTLKDLDNNIVYPKTSADQIEGLVTPDPVDLSDYFESKFWADMSSDMYNDDTDFEYVWTKEDIDLEELYNILKKAPSMIRFNATTSFDGSDVFKLQRISKTVEEDGNEYYGLSYESTGWVAHDDACGCMLLNTALLTLEVWYNPSGDPQYQVSTSLAIESSTGNPIGLATVDTETFQYAYADITVDDYNYNRYSSNLISHLYNSHESSCGTLYSIQMLTNDETYGSMYSSLQVTSMWLTEDDTDYWKVQGIGPVWDAETKTFKSKELILTFVVEGFKELGEADENGNVPGFYAVKIIEDKSSLNDIATTAPATGETVSSAVSSALLSEDNFGVFYLNDKAYRFEQGTSWNDFCENSELNGDGEILYVTSYTVHSTSNDATVYSETDGYQYSGNWIRNGEHYTAIVE